MLAPAPSVQASGKVGITYSKQSADNPAQTDDRFDPYKRPRGSSPSLVTSSPAFPLSPSRSTTAMTMPQSPGHPPLYPSTLSTSIPTRHSKPHGHPYTRPMASRSRAASPALSTGSRASFTLGQLGAGTGLGGLGLLSLTNGIGRSGRKEDGVEEGVEMVRGDSGESREAMEED